MTSVQVKRRAVRSDTRPASHKKRKVKEVNQVMHKFSGVELADDCVLKMLDELDASDAPEFEDESGDDGEDTEVTMRHGFSPRKHGWRGWSETRVRSQTQILQPGLLHQASPHHHHSSDFDPDPPAGVWCKSNKKNPRVFLFTGDTGMKVPIPSQQLH